MDQGPVYCRPHYHIYWETQSDFGLGNAFTLIRKRLYEPQNSLDLTKSSRFKRVSSDCPMSKAKAASKR